MTTGRITPEEVVEAFRPGDFAIRPQCFIRPADGRPACGCAVGALEYRRLGPQAADEELNFPGIDGLIKVARARGLDLDYLDGFSAGFSFPWTGDYGNVTPKANILGKQDGRAARAAVIAAFRLHDVLFMTHNPGDVITIPATETTATP